MNFTEPTGLEGCEKVNSRHCTQHIEIIPNEKKRGSSDGLVTLTGENAQQAISQNKQGTHIKDM